MALAIRHLKAIQRSGGGDIGAVLQRLREQQAASRTAGCAPIVHLCQSVEDCLTLERLLAPVRGRNQPPRASMVAALVDACRAIQLYAEALDKTASCLSRHDGTGSLPSRR